MNYLTEIRVLLENILERVGQGSGGDDIPTPQQNWEDGSDKKYIYSDKFDINKMNREKVVPNIKSCLEQTGGKLKFRWWLWGDDNRGKVYGTDPVPVASPEADGAMSKEDKVILDATAKKVIKVEEELNGVSEVLSEILGESSN